jgi:hypothetical protein
MSLHFDIVESEDGKGKAKLGKLIAIVMKVMNHLTLLWILEGSAWL